MWRKLVCSKNVNFYHSPWETHLTICLGFVCWLQKSNVVILSLKMQRSAEIMSMYSTSRNPHKFVGASDEQFFCLHPNPAIESGQGGYFYCINDEPSNPASQNGKHYSLWNLASCCLHLSILQATTSTWNEQVENCSLPGVKNVSVSSCINAQQFVTEVIRLSFAYLFLCCL